MHRRLVGLHTRAVYVTATTERGREIADFVCGALQAGPSEATESLVVPLLQDLASSAEHLMGELVTRLVWDYADGLALHGAAVELEGQTLLFPAVSGAGKSTLAVYLAASGARFLTDELVFVPLETSELHALARPAHLKSGSLFLLERFPALAAPQHTLRYAHGALLAPSAFQSPAQARGVRALQALAFPEYLGPEAAAAAPSALEPMTKGAATYALLSSLVNARNLPALGVAAAGRLAAALPAYRLRYRTLDEARACLAPLGRLESSELRPGSA